MHSAEGEVVGVVALQQVKLVLLRVLLLA